MGGLELQRKSVMNVNGLLSKDTREDEDGNGNEEDSCSVCVAVKIRPLVTSEQEHGCRGTLAVAGGQQVTTEHSGSKHQFTYDAVFGEGGQEASLLYPKCVSALVEGLFRGYNATVFAYGQTGSGKTYTMGSEYKPGKQSTVGVIPETIHSIFSRIEASKDWQCTVRVGFVEIHKEEVRDLLIATSGPRPAVSIRESPGGGVCLYGATEMEVRTQEEMAAVLEMGTLCRATASTGMNDRSSRSHAIFTITLEQRRQVSTSPGGSTGRGGNNDGGGNSARGMRSSRVMGEEDDDDGDDTGLEGDQGIDDYLCAKMHLVDLAGSERAKRTKAEGARLKEGIHINRGLLSLGNVINAIVDNHKHIPYRDSKLTRLLQDSLGGNSRTVMIACVSPADINFEETLNTLRYADRARHIRNKPKINRDPIAAQVAYLRQMLSQARNDNAALRRALADEGRDLADIDAGQAGSGWEYTQHLKQHNRELELDNTKLNIQVEDLRKELAAANDRMFGLQADLELARAAHTAPQGAGVAADGGNESGAATGGEGSAGLPKHDVLKAHIARIAELERELRNMRQFHSLRRAPSCAKGERSRRSSAMDGAAGDTIVHGPATPNGANSPNGASQGGCNGVLEEDTDEGESGSDAGSRDDGNVDEEMFYAEMAAHAFEQEKLKQDMLALQRMLETKERKMADLTKNSGQVPALRQQYDRVLLELQKERDGFMAEKAAIMQKLQQLQATSEEERRRLEAHYKEKLKTYDEKLRDVRRKEREFIVMQKLKLRTEEMCNRLNADIHRIKLQKVALQKTMEGSAKQFAQWRAEREKELLQLRKQNRRNTAQIQSLEAMQAKQNAVLQRKIADAAAARKKLKELQAAGKEGGFAQSTSFASTNGSVHASAANRPSTTGELQPNAQAPLLRNEKARRDWIEMELDNCNLSYEYRRVLDGELAQRAEAIRLMKEVEKRLMIANDLVPASPLIPSGSVRPPLPPANIAGRARLVERKAQLEAQVKEHNQQIVELQAAWEKAKQEEENKGGGAADAKRWTGVRNAIEARELLRTVFRIACDHKTQGNEAALQTLKLQEEIELMRVQLDAARKEVEAQQKRCAAIEASAATAMASPYTGSGGHPHYRHTNDEMDTECDDLLQELQVVAQSPGKPAPDDAAADEVALGSPDGSVQNSQELMPGRAPAAGKPSRLDLSQAASQLMRCSTAQNGLGPGSGRYASMSTYDQDTIKGAPEDEEMDEEDDTDSAEEMDSLDPDDTDWDPAHPTPTRGNSRKSTLNSNSSSGRHLSGRHSSSGQRRSARPSILDPNTFSIPAMVAAATTRLGAQPQASDQAPVPRPPRPSNAAAGEPASMSMPKPNPDAVRHAPQSHRISMSSLGSVTSSVALPLQELPVLEDINKKRAAAGEEPATRLTVKLLKDNLAGSTGPDGKIWRAGNKTREQLLRDYRIKLGLPVESAANDAPSAAAPEAAPEQLEPATLPAQGSTLSPQSMDSSAAALPPPLVLSPPQPFVESTAGAGGTTGAIGAGGATQGRDRGSVGEGITLQPPLQPAPEPASPRPNWLQRVPTSAASPSPSFNSRKTGGDAFGFGSRILEESTPSPISGLSSMGRSANSPSAAAGRGSHNGAASGGGNEGEHAMTPLSKLYIQKAQEARDRTALLRQSISRSSSTALPQPPSTPPGTSAPSASASRSPRMDIILNNIQGSQQQPLHQAVVPSRTSPAIKVGVNTATGSASPRSTSYANAAARGTGQTPSPASTNQGRPNIGRSPSGGGGGWNTGGIFGSGSASSSPNALATPRRGNRGGSPGWR